jgi:hypothetical protein
MNNQYTHKLKSSDLDSESSIDYIRKEVTKNTMMKAFQSEKDTIVDAMPATGKTHNTFDVTKELGVKLLYCAGRTKLYEDAEERCEKRDLDYEVLPSITRDCPTFTGENGESWQDTFQELYNKGVYGKNLHKNLHPPCQDDCAYQQKWDEIRRDNPDVLIGHYSHANLENVTEDRVVVFDEFAESGFMFQTEHPETYVTNFLKRNDGLPFNSYNELLRDKRNEDKEAEAVDWFNNNGVEEDVEDLINGNSNAHSKAGLMAACLLLMDPLSDTNFSSTYGLHINDQNTPFDLSRDDLIGNTECVLNNENNELWLLQPPDIDNAKSVVGLDGTPTKIMWDTILDTNFEFEQVIPTELKDHYVHNVLGLNLYQPTFDGNGGMKPYNNDRNITSAKDGKLMYGMGMKFGEEPSLISTKTAVGSDTEIGEYEKNDVLQYAKEPIRNYGDIRSSNDFNSESVGMISGCPHPGDDTIGMWLGLMGYPLFASGRGTERDYGGIGDPIYKHFVHNEVLQATLRFSREDKQADVLVNTLATPDWLTSEGLDLWMLSKGARKIRDYLIETEGSSQNELVENLKFDKSTISRILSNFDDESLTGIAGTDDNGNLRYSWEGQ